MRTRFFRVGDLIWAAVSMAALLVVIAYVGQSSRHLQANDIEEIDELLDSFEEAYSGQKTGELRPLFLSKAVIAYDEEQGERQAALGLDEWLQGTQEDVFDANDHISDTLSDRDVVVYRNVAYAVCNYTYVDDDQTSMGVDVFTFLKFRNHWRILSLQWTGDKVR